MTLRGVDSATVTAAMEYRYPPGAYDALDDDRLSRFGSMYVGCTATRTAAIPEGRRAHLPG